MKYKQALNGFSIETPEGEILYQDSNDDNEIERFQEFLCFLRDTLGPTTSRHSKERIYIEVRPGDKWEGKD